MNLPRPARAYVTFRYDGEVAKRQCEIEGCDKPHYGRGMCQMHYSRQRIGGTTDLRGHKMDPEPRFWKRVDKTAECWLWTGAKANTGYGQLRVDGNAVYAHRLSYEWAHGPIPAGMQVDHTCRNRACVRPDHLRLATGKQNSENLGLSRSNSSGVRGVYRAPSGWAVQVVHNRQRHSGGVHADLGDAEAAAIALRNSLFTHNLDNLR